MGGRTRAWDIVNFDSGGSAAIVIDGDMLNLPGRGSIRPVEDAMLAVSLAPEDNDVSQLAFSLQRINPFVISRTPLTVMAFNQYGEVLDSDLEGCEFEVVPPTLGYVDAEAVFHSSHTEEPAKSSPAKTAAKHASTYSPMTLPKSPLRIPTCSPTTLRASSPASRVNRHVAKSTSIRALSPGQLCPTALSKSTTKAL